MKLAAVVAFIFECWLSHQIGEKSGEESKALARVTGIEEGWLRRAAHVVLFLALSAFAGLGFGWMGIGAVAVWAAADEATKPLIQGRHFSWFDVGLNLVGVVAGVTVWLITG